MPATDKTDPGVPADPAALQAELEALRRSEQRYRNLFENASDGILIGSADGRFVEVNARACEMTGYPAAQLVGKRPQDLWAAGEQAMVWPQSPSAAPVQFERELRRQDGSVFLAEVSVRRVDAETVQAILRDVTERRQMEEAMHRYAERLVSLHRLDQAILSLPSSHAVAEAAVENLGQFIPADHLSVLALDPDTGDYDLLAARPKMSPRLLEGLRKLGEAVDEPAEIRIVRDLGGGWEMPALDTLHGQGYGSLIRVPLVAHGEVIGVLHLLAAETDAFTVEYVDVARETAIQLALAIQSARLFEEVQAARERLEQLSRELVRVQEAERRRLALELHDEIGQVLTALHLSLDVADPAAGVTRDNLSRARQIVEVLTGKVRNLSLDLRPTLLDDLGLLPALLWYVKRYTDQTGVNVAFRHAGLTGMRFSAEVETAAYRIVQEALTNVARHAEVEEVEVQAWAEDDVLTIRIEDTGRGFERADPSQRPSTGLSGMRERARLVGGELTVTTAPGEGVRVSAVLPQRGPDAAA